MRIQTYLFSAIILLLVLIACSTTDERTAMPTSDRGARLFAENCASCHGEFGGGDGAAAIGVEVTPRDFRREAFRYISTMDGAPRREDVAQTIRFGRRFGEMPAHPMLNDREVDLLTDFVLETHRLEWVRRLRSDPENADLDDDEIAEIAAEKVRTESPLEVPPLPADLAPNTAVGRKLYVANCASCHGPTGRGDGLDMPKDDQGKPIEVRDLTGGRFRGGMGLREVFRRIRCGVPGTPMASQANLSDEDVWQLVHYSLHLSRR